MKFNVMTMAVMVAGIALGVQANAAMTTDGHGNVGYDSYDECVAAVKAGDANFYTPYTYEKPKHWKGEVAVEKMLLNQVVIPQSAAANMPVGTRNYSEGACDRGVGRSNGRSGVSGVLVGKYVPFAPDMPVNVYKNSAGVPVRITMQQCDNHFSGRFPTGVITSLPAPDPQLRIEEDVTVDGLITNEVRTIRRNYVVKEVIVAPEEQVRRVAMPNGSAIAVQNVQNQSVVVGRQTDARILEQAVIPNNIPVVVVPEVNRNQDVNTPQGTITTRPRSADLKKPSESTMPKYNR